MEKPLIKVCLLTITLSLLMGAGASLAPSASGILRSDQAPLIPERPTTAANQADAYEALPLPGESTDNWYGKPFLK